MVAPGSYVFQDGQFIGSAPDRSKDEGAKVRDVNAARREEAIAAGLDPNSPQGRAYILGGKIGADRDLSAGDRKAINEAKDHAVQLDQTIETLSRAKELNDKTFTGVTAGIRGKIGTTVPGAGYILDQKSAEATREFNQIMSMEAIKAMSPTPGKARRRIARWNASWIFWRSFDSAEHSGQYHQSNDDAGAAAEGTCASPHRADARRDVLSPRRRRVRWWRRGPPACGTAERPAERPRRPVRATHRLRHDEGPAYNR